MHVVDIKASIYLALKGPSTLKDHVHSIGGGSDFESQIFSFTGYLNLQSLSCVYYKSSFIKERKKMWPDLGNCNKAEAFPTIIV